MNVTMSKQEITIIIIIKIISQTFPKLSWNHVQALVSSLPPHWMVCWFLLLCFPCHQEHHGYTIQAGQHNYIERLWYFYIRINAKLATKGQLTIVHLTLSNMSMIICTYITIKHTHTIECTQLGH